MKQTRYLNLKQVREIRANEDNLSQRKLAEKYNVMACVVHSIIHNKSYYDPDYTPPELNQYKSRIGKIPYTKQMELDL